MNTPEVTIIVPSFNAGHFLEWTLNSIAAQTLKNFECIVVDDCSTDDSIVRVKRYFSDPRFRLIRHKMNLGLSGARNTGLRAALGEFVAFLDSDDLIMQNSLEVRLNSCRWGQGVSDRFVGSYCGSMQIEETLKVAPKSNPQKLDFVTFVSANGHCPFNANQPMLRRDILRHSGGFNHGMKQAEDFDLWLRILRAGYIFAPAKFSSVTYRRRAGSMVRKQPLAHLNLSLAIINSAERPLADDQLDWSPKYRMTKPASTYGAQQKKINRILEFVGMNLASEEPETIETLASLITSEIPDLRLLMHTDDLIETTIQKGIKRQKTLAEPVAPEDLAAVEKLVLAIAKMAGRPQQTQRDEAITSVIYSDPSKDRSWFTGMQSRYQIVFIPHSPYHVWTISLIGKTLNEMGVDFITVDVSAEWRDGKVRSAAAEHGVELIALSEFILGRYKPRAIVTFNDWDPVTRPILVAAKAAGIRTIAIVEGVQDYDDADVSWQRYAYKTSDVVLLPGDFDKKYFETHKAVVDTVGVPRLEVLRTKEIRVWQKDKKPRVLINCNFSYGVLAEHRDQWLTDCVQAVQELGMIPVISKHPADTGELFPELVTSQSFYDEIETCDVSIQRFGSGVLEALARHVGVIYYNPHGEKIDKFQTDPMDAYVLAHTKGALITHLTSWWELHKLAHKNGGRFLDHHAGLLGDGAIQRCAVALKKHMSGLPDDQALSIFRKNLFIIDGATSAFTQLRFNGVALFPDPVAAAQKLVSMGGEIYANANTAEENLMAERENEELVESKPLTATFREMIFNKGGETALIISVASALLLNRIEALFVLESNEDIKSAMNRALDLRPKDDELRMHYNQVFDFAKRQHTPSKTVV